MAEQGPAGGGCIGPVVLLTERDDLAQSENAASWYPRLISCSPMASSSWIRTAGTSSKSRFARSMATSKRLAPSALGRAGQVDPGEGSADLLGLRGLETLEEGHA